MVGNITVDGKPLRDVIEMNGHDEIVRQILAMRKGDVRISESRIKAIHRAIMFEEEGTKKQQIGQWKKEGNHLINYKGEKFHFTPPDEVPDRIHQLLNETNAALDALSITNKKKDRKHPVLIALEFHLAYVNIHTFYDGNGRTGRILMNLLLIAAGYPPIIIRTEEKERYYRYLADIQCYGGQSDLLYDFLSGLLIRSQQLVLDAIAGGKDIEEMEDWEKELELLRQQQQEPAQLKPKTEDLIRLRLEDSFLPFFDHLHRKLSRFNEHFTISDLEPHIRGNIVLYGNTSFIDNLGHLAEEGKLHRITAIELNCHWQGYKKRACVLLA